MAQHWIHIDANCSEEGGTLRITGPEAEHAARAKRLTPGSLATLFDGRGRIAQAEVIEAKKTSLLLRIREEERRAPLLPPVQVLAATPKGERADRLIEGLSQLGAASFQPLRTERSVVHPRQGKLQRWRRLAIESAKQCGRAHLLQIQRLIDLDTVLSGGCEGSAGHGAELIVFDPRGVYYQASDPADELRLLVGPEGGWTDDELKKCETRGAQIVALPGHTLRIEIAALAGLAIVMQEQGKLNKRENHSCDARTQSP